MSTIRRRPIQFNENPLPELPELEPLEVDPREVLDEPVVRPVVVRVPPVEVLRDELLVLVSPNISWSVVCI